MQFTQSIPISKEVMQVAMDLSIASPSFKFTVYLDDPSDPLAKKGSMSHPITKMEGVHEFIRMNDYIWREATPDEEDEDFRILSDAMVLCDTFEMSNETKKVSRFFSTTDTQTIYTYIASDSKIHTSIQDYSFHLETNIPWHQVEEELFKRELQKTLPIGEKVKTKRL